VTAAGDRWQSGRLVDLIVEHLRSVVAIAFLGLGGFAWWLAIRRIAPRSKDDGAPRDDASRPRPPKERTAASGLGESIGIQERWGGFGHGLGGWQVTPAFALVLIGASAIGIGITVMQSVPVPPAIEDADVDGVTDSSDACGAAKEDFDGFQDEDGCPDPDNDADGSVDASDKCPIDAEDVDGFQDENGCPDPDNDADAILDEHDRCPSLAEDRNGRDDADGCPDLPAAPPAPTPAPAPGAPQG